jgi:7-keto-8-aminopelargonate synthetase-like enzyme
VAQQLARELQELGFDVRYHGTPILPVIVGDSEEASRCSGALLEAGVWCPPIRPPTVPVGSSRLRVTASAALSDDDIERAVQTFGRVRHEYSKGGYN